jgi:hypothetical protein
VRTHSDAIEALSHSKGEPAWEREFDPLTGRPLIPGCDDLQGLTDDELQAEVTIAAAEPSRRAHRLEALLLELARRAPSVAA